jgi:twitching motility protein PilT
VEVVKPIDSLLRIMIEQGATELRLASDQRPLMLKGDVELPLMMLATPTETIQRLLDDLWTLQSAALREHGRVSVGYQSAQLGAFDVKLVQLAGSALEVSFQRPAAAVQDGGQSGAGHREPAAQPGTVAATAAAPRDATPGKEESSAELPSPMIAALARAASRGASDVHFSQGRRPMIRIDGELYALDGADDVDVAALVVGRAQLDQIRSGRSLDRALDVPAVGRVRVNVYTSEEGLCAAVRILRKTAPELEELNLPPVLESLVKLPHGLVIACGPTGSGKSATLAALAQRAMQTRSRVLISLEDPIEYIIRPVHEAGLVRQREVGAHVRDFATGLRDALREDPDLILIGEMRDPETIGFALTAAETGHLVLTSLHSRTAASAVERIVDTYPPERQRQIRVQLADALRAVISQRLLPRAKGAGRVPAVELLKVTYAVASLIREGRTAQIVSAIQAGGEEGMLPLERTLADLVRAGTIRREAAVAVANDVRMLNEYLRG